MTSYAIKLLWGWGGESYSAATELDGVRSTALMKQMGQFAHLKTARLFVTASTNLAQAFSIIANQATAESHFVKGKPSQVRMDYLEKCRAACVRIFREMRITCFTC